MISEGTFTKASLALAAAETHYNLDHIDFVGLANSGLQYLADGWPSLPSHEAGQ